MITREISFARSHLATKHTGRDMGEKMQADAVHKLEGQSSKKSVPEPAERDLLGRNAASAIAMKNLINMAGRHMIHDASETERRRLGRLLDSLTKRQNQCACWAFCGMSNKEIGHEIGCAT